MLKNAITTRRTLVVLAIILTAFVLIALVIWVFDKRINEIKNKVENTSGAAVTGQSMRDFFTENIPLQI